MTVLRFGVFELDTAVPELRRGTRRVHLQQVPLRVLEVLLEHPGELVTRETLYSRLWPDDELGILDDNLNTAIRKLRLALEDSAHRPRYIETVPKRGYRFVASVTREEPIQLEPPPALPTSGSLAPPPASSRRVSKTVIAAVVVTAIILITSVTLLVSRTPLDESPEDTSAKTVAVLPFVNASGNPEDEYFSNGLSEEIMDRLARSDELRVVSRTSAHALRAKDLSARETGELLNAKSLVEGSVRREGDRLRINVRLINAEDGYQLWSEIYDRRLHDVLRVQEEIAHSIAQRLSGRLPAARTAVVNNIPAADPLAYDLYLKGRFAWHRRTQSSLRSAVDYLEQAAQRAPQYASAWAGLADAYAVLGFYDYLAPTDAFPKAKSAALRALQIDPENASAYATLGYAALYFDWDFATAETHFREAIVRDPNLSKTHQWYGNLLTAAGRFEAAEQQMRRAQQLDPLSLIASAALGWSLYHAGRHDEAITQFQLTLALDPNFELAYLWSGWTLEAMGDYDQALTAIKEAVKLSGGSGISTASLARLHAVRGEGEIAKRTLDTLLTSGTYVPAYEISKAWMAMGSMDQAEKWLQRAYDQRSHSLVFLDVDPQLAGHRESTAVKRIAERLQASGE